MSAGIVLPFDLPGFGVNGIDIGAVAVDDARSEIGDAVIHQHTRIDRPGGAEVPIDHDIPLDWSCTEAPEQTSGGRFQGIDISITTTDVRPGLPDSGRHLNRPGGGEDPTNFSGPGIEGADLTVLSGYEDKSASRGGGGRYMRLLWGVRPGRRRRLASGSIWSCEPPGRRACALVVRPIGRPISRRNF